jgi:sarcosine oxidase subunit gamma
MSTLTPAFTARTAFEGLPLPVADGTGVQILNRDGRGLATILVKKGQGKVLAQRLQERYSITLPQGPQRAHSGNMSLIGTGPGAWFATSEHGGNSFAAELSSSLGELASISDQTDGYAVLRLSGPRLRDALAKLIPLDLYSSAFAVGQAASTSAAHIGVTLWRLEDDAHGAPVFEIALYRSFASSFWHALIESAAEFGVAAPR